MSNPPYLSKIIIYPIKSLDGVEVPSRKILASGALQGDRQFAIIDSVGNFVNGKRNPKVHLLRTQFDLENHTVEIRIQNSARSQKFDLEPNSPLEAWLSDFFAMPVKLQENLHTGFPDDLDSPGPTVISTATLEAVGSWFPDLDIEQMRSRFRANLEISGVTAFEEDRLFTDANTSYAFQIGEVKFEGINPCQRCIVPTRDPFTGESYPQFQPKFTKQRKETLPNFVNSSRFNHFYRLSVNTRVPTTEVDKILSTGDHVRI